MSQTPDREFKVLLRTGIRVFKLDRDAIRPLNYSQSTLPQRLCEVAPFLGTVPLILLQGRNLVHCL